MLEFDCCVHHQEAHKRVERPLSVAGHWRHEAAGRHKHPPEPNSGIREEGGRPVEEEAPQHMPNVEVLIEPPILIIESSPVQYIKSIKIKFKLIPKKNHKNLK